MNPPWTGAAKPLANSKPVEPVKTVPQISPFGNTIAAQERSKAPNWQQHAAALWAATNDPYPFGKKGNLR